MHNSFKQSIFEYTLKQKAKETVDDKAIFHWKLITLLFSILLICSLAFFSQIYSGIQLTAVYPTDASFLHQLLTDTHITQSTLQINNLVKGISLSKPLMYHAVESIALPSTVPAIIDFIRDQEDVLFLFQSESHKFGIFLSQSPKISRSRTDTIQPLGQQLSTVFNLKTGEIYAYNNPSCQTYSIDAQKGALTLVSSISVQDGSMKIRLRDQNCFGGDRGGNRFFSLTNLASRAGEDVYVPIKYLEVYRLR